MIKYNIDNINKIIKDTGKQVVLFGAGQIGEMCLYAMQQKKIKVDFFCDSMKRKQGLNFDGIKTLSPEELKKLDPHTNIFISNNYVSVVNEQLKKDNFKIYDMRNLYSPLKMKRLKIQYYGIGR